MITPFDAAGELDIAAAGALARYLVDEQACDGLVINGTTGESPTTSDDEKRRMVAAVLDAVGDRAAVVAGVGTSDTAHSVKLAAAAAAEGAHGLLVVSPYYSKPPQPFLVRHFTTIADSTELPVMLYDIPGRTGVPIETATLIELATHPRIVAVKDAKGDLYATQQVMAATDLIIYNGVDELNLAAYALGAVGAVSVTSHLAGATIAAMFDAIDAGDLVTARRLNDELLPVTRGIMCRTQGLVAVKAALSARGLATGSPRPPLFDADDELRAAIEADLKEAGR